ncbi:DUF6449 domain-containing protein [Paenibacillus tengchongensis]|uniref:DUF6449 domain-containing protein n=1 Tax=Paenibacillus tengchongensis TaxID=2608684 RepID=UPI00124C8B76|nr:DUF6449 domain-containing protein [Paenibacillus tengchongensis]
MMRSRFFFNGGIFRQNMRQHGWIGIMYTLGMFFSVPLQMLLGRREDQPPLTVDSLFDIAGNVQMLFILTLPVAAALFQFRYLQARQPSDLWHSLPLRRERLLGEQLLSGGVLLLVPVWLNAILAAVLLPLESNAFAYQGEEVWMWCLSVSVITLFFYVFGIFIGICTGQTVLQGIVIYILLMLPAALLLLVSQHFNRYLYGYPDNGYLGRVDNWSPVFKLMDISVDPFSLTEIGIYAALSAVFAGLSFLLYRRRHAEKTGYALAFTYFNPLFKAGVMLCAMLISGAYFASVQNGRMGWTISGYILGALIGYIAAEMVIRKSWHIVSRKTIVEFAVYAAALGLIIYIPVSGLSGYEKRVPAADRIVGVYAGDHYRMFETGGNPQDALARAEGAFAGDKDYIAAVRLLHQSLVTAQPKPEEMERYSYSGSRYFTIAYELESGRKLIRNYWIPVAGFEPEMKAVMESADFKRKQFMVFGLGGEVESFRFSNMDKVFNVSDPAEIAELKGILEREIMTLSFDEQHSGIMPRASIQTIAKPDDTGYQIYYNYDWYPYYEELDQWMEHKGYADKIRTLPSEVESVEIINNDFFSKLSEAQKDNLDDCFALARSEKQTVLTTDAAVIADILDHQRNFSGVSGEYVVNIKYANDYGTYLSISGEDATPAIRALFAGS